MSPSASLIASAVLALSLAACGPAVMASSPPPDGLTQAKAVEAATRLAGPHAGDLTVESARAGTFSALGGGVSLRGIADDHWVWSIVLRGEFAASCPSTSPSSAPTSAASSCPASTLSHDTVLIDYRDGTLLLSSLAP